MNLGDMLPKIWANKAGIAEGIKNRIFKKEHIEELHEHRMTICEECPWYSENVRFKNYEELIPDIRMKKSESYIQDSQKRTDKHCVNCSCNLGLKTRCLSCNCPLKKWLAVVDEKEQDTIMDIAKSNM